MATVHYVGLNGASWNFHTTQNLLEQFRLVGNTINNGFETVYMSAGYAQWTFAEAVVADGTSLGETRVQATVMPSVSSEGNSSIVGQGNLDLNDEMQIELLKNKKPFSKHNRRVMQEEREDQSSMTSASVQNIG